MVRIVAAALGALGIVEILCLSLIIIGLSSP